MPRRSPRDENPRPHPVQPNGFSARFTVAGVQFKHVSGDDYIQVTMLTRKTDQSWRDIGALAGRVCGITAVEVVDPVLEGMSMTGTVVTELSAIDASHMALVQVDGDDGVPPAENVEEILPQTARRV